MHAKRLRWGVAAGTAILATTAGIALAAAGDLDTTFGEGGRVTIDFGGSEKIAAIAMQPDGKVVAVGSTTNAVNPGDAEAFAMMRLLPNGALDTSFGDTGTGRQIYGLGPSARAHAVAVQPNGKIIVAGEGGAGDSVFTFIRLNPNGVIDPSFGTNGVTGIDVGPDEDVALAIAIAPDGKIVATGITYEPTQGDTGDVAVVRLNANGTIDEGFSGDGKLALNFGPFDAGFDLSILPDGRAVIAATDFRDFVVTRLTAAGELDASFGTQGKTAIDFDPAADQEMPSSLAVDPAGRLLVAGATVIYDDQLKLLAADFAVARLSPNGALDPGFDSDGKATVGFGGKEEAAASVTLQADGSILVSGSAGDDGSGINVARLTAAGALDPSFGTGGRAEFTFGAPTLGGMLALQGANKAVIAGARDVDEPVDDDFLFARIDVSPPPSNPTDPTDPTPTPPGGSATSCAGRVVTVPGTESADTLKGTPGDDVISALGGNDDIKGGGGADTICGGDGNDKESGGPGADKLLGEDGRDRMKGGGGPDTLKGGAGDDFLNGGGGKNVVRGGPGQDQEKP